MDAACATTTTPLPHKGGGSRPSLPLVLIPFRRNLIEELHVSDPIPVIPAEARPRLPRGVRLVHNEAQGGWVLLAPERVFKADPIAAEIVKRCTGEASFGEIVDDLVKTYAAPRDKILADASALLRGLADKRLLEL